MSENLMEIVEKRKEELIFEVGDESEFDELKINAILRDEFPEEKYSTILEELGVNESETGLEEQDEPEDNLGDSNLDDKDKLTKILLHPEIHLYDLEKKLKGYDKEKNKHTRKRKFLIPSDEIDAIIGILTALCLPQSLISNLKTSLKSFEDSMNKKVNNIRNLLAHYPDDIVSRTEMRITIDILLSEILVIKNAISSGRLGNLSRDILIGSYNEKEETDNSRTESKLAQLKAMG